MSNEQPDKDGVNARPWHLESGPGQKWGNNVAICYGDGGGRNCIVSAWETPEQRATFEHIVAVHNASLTLTLPSHALEIDCPKCKGSGTMDVMTQGYGPDDHLESVQCDGCKGTGTTPSTTPQKTNDLQQLIYLVEPIVERGDFLMLQPRDAKTALDAMRSALSATPHNCTAPGSVLHGGRCQKCGEQIIPPLIAFTSSNVERLTPAELEHLIEWHENCAKFSVQSDNFKGEEHHQARAAALRKVDELLCDIGATTPHKIEHPGRPCPHGKPHELDGRCATCDCGKPTNSDCCKFVVSMLRGPIRQPALADRVLELIEENAARASATSATPCKTSETAIAAAKRGIKFSVATDLGRDFYDVSAELLRLHAADGGKATNG